MKKYYLIVCVCLASATAFCQSQKMPAPEKIKDAKMLNMAAMADTSLIDKKNIVDDTKKKRPRREKNHKECSRMKS